MYYSDGTVLCNLIIQCQVPGKVCCSDSNFVLCRGVRLSSFDDFLYKAESASHEPFCARNGNPRQVTQISNWREHKNTVGISYFVCWVLLVLKPATTSCQGGAGKNETSLFFSILWQIFDTISQCTSSMCSGRNEKCNEKMQFRNCHYAAFASALREKTNV